MNAWQKRNQSSPQDNGVGRYAYLSTPSKGAPDFGSSLGHSAAASSRFRARLKMLSALLYVVGVLAMLLFVYGDGSSFPTRTCSPSTGPGIGHLLERARRRRSVSLEEAEKATRIHKDFLERLESDDHSAMPEPIYVRGFVKAYANYLGLDGDRFAAQIAFWQERRRRARRGPLGGIRNWEL